MTNFLHAAIAFVPIPTQELKDAIAGSEAELEHTTDPFRKAQLECLIRAAKFTIKERKNDQ